MTYCSAIFRSTLLIEPLTIYSVSFVTFFAFKINKMKVQSLCSGILESLDVDLHVSGMPQPTNQ